MQNTLVLVKPDGLQRGLVGEVISRFEKKGLKLKGLKMIKLTDKIVEEWYHQHVERDFFGDLKNFMKATPIIAMIWSGEEAIRIVRRIVGVTKSFEAEAGSIRGDYGLSGQNNLVHASDSVDNALREMGILFENEEIFNYISAADALVYSTSEYKKNFTDSEG